MNNEKTSAFLEESPYFCEKFKREGITPVLSAEDIKENLIKSVRQLIAEILEEKSCQNKNQKVKKRKVAPKKSQGIAKKVS